MTIDLLQEQQVSCPYCGESITLLVDCTLPEQSYTEDCSVCCQPILVNLVVEEEVAIVDVAREND